jgi:UDP-N-acetylmuramoylalanine--D-glutamate ligase
VLPKADGVWLREDEGHVVLSQDGKSTVLFQVGDVPLRGRFNVLNAAAAAAAATILGVPPDALRDAVRSFRPVEHRLELVRVHEGVEYYNDSIATTPESTVVALRALGPNTIVICGGSSKGASFQALGQALSWHSRAVILLGQTADAIGASIHPRKGGPLVLREGSLEAAVERARSLARSGDRVVLSPACASFDMFLNFVERGQRFKAAVRRLGEA